MASAGLWGWSRRLPESIWESSTTAPLPSPEVEPKLAMGPEPTPPPPSVSETAAPPDSTPAPAETSAPVRVPTEIPPTAATPIPPNRPPSEEELAGPLPAAADPAASHSNPPAAPISVIPAAQLDIGEIARQPQLWPRQIVLLAPARFPVILNGVNVGNVQLPSGRAVILRKVDADGFVEIELQGSLTKVKAQATDIVARAQAMAAAKKSDIPSP